MFTLEVSKKIINQFKRQVKDAFPKETIAYLCGTLEYDLLTVEDLWIPENVLKYCNHNTVNVRPEWPVEAIEYASDNDMSILGTIHSHPFTKEELKVFSATGKHQSEADIDSCGMAWQQISGICVVKEQKTGRLVTSIRFWGPTIPLDVRIK